MNQSAQSAAKLDEPVAGLPRLLRLAWRYGLSTFGPVAVSGAHFLASLVFLRNLPAAEFGTFSFVLVIAPFCMSMSGALVTSPIATARHSHDPNVIASCMKLNPALSLLATASIFVFLLISHTMMGAALLLAGFGGALTFRWFLRCYAYVDDRILTAVSSDLAYSFSLICGLGALVLTHNVTLDNGAVILFMAALISLLPYGRRFVRLQIGALRRGSMRLYRSLWHDMTRWALIGVVLTEMTANAHAYLVTFISGPSAFAPLALGMLLMRPVSLVQSALPDMERPVIAHAIAAGNYTGALRVMRDFRIAVGAAWLGTVTLATALLIWAPQLLLKKGYDTQQIMAATALCATIMAIRTLRAPHAMLLQAAGEFKTLASIGTKSGIVSVVATLGLLLAFGPIASLGGVLLGDLTILLVIMSLTREWKLAHA
jgi:hypothetical protein